VTVLIWGVAAEPPVAAVRTALAAHATPTLFVDQQRIRDARIEFSVDASGVRGCLSTADGICDLRDVTAVYARPYDTRLLPSIAAAGVHSPAWQHAIAFDTALWAWAEVTSALVVNRLGPTSTNGSKPYQLERIRGAGFQLPATLITTDAAHVQAFWATHRDVVYKSISSTRSIVHRLTDAHRARLADIGTCPTQFQQQVHGTDFRVHVVGDEIFACAINSTASDYRYAGECDVTIVSTCLPESVAARCRDAARLLELPVAGVDLRRTPNDEWYCFEVNPSPAFTFFEEATGQPIGAAIARLLTGANTDVGESGELTTPGSPTPLFGAYPA
jgi:hypothetical protein